MMHHHHHIYHHHHYVSGLATVISLPLNMWIVSLEEDKTSLELREKLCSVHVVVRIVHRNHYSFHNLQVRVTVQQICVNSSFLTGAFRFFLVLHADGLIRRDRIAFVFCVVFVIIVDHTLSLPYVFFLSNSHLIFLSGNFV